MIIGEAIPAREEEKSLLDLRINLSSLFFLFVFPCVCPLRWTSAGTILIPVPERVRSQVGDVSGRTI